MFVRRLLFLSALSAVFVIFIQGMAVFLSGKSISELPDGLFRLSISTLLLWFFFLTILFSGWLSLRWLFMNSSEYLSNPQAVANRGKFPPSLFAFRTPGNAEILEGSVFQGFNPPPAMLRPRQVESVYQAICHHPNLIVITTSSQGTIQSLSEAAEKLLEYPAGDLVDRENFARLFAQPEITSRLEEMPAAADDEMMNSFAVLVERARQGIIAEQEWTCVSRSGQQIPVKMTLAPLHQTAGETSGFLVLLHDLREQRRAESQRQHLETQLFQTQRLESLGTMAGGIAHDFNNILTAILGNVQLMQRLVPEGSHTAEYLKDIHSAARRASSLTQQLLSFSRGQNSERSSINLNVLISNLLRMLQRIIGEDVEISFLPSETISHVLANVSQMEQVLVNLVVNARDAMPDGGSLLILTSPAKTASMHSSGHKSILAGEYIQLSIVDSGTGMDAATLAHVFEPFFTTRSPGTGTGLGLPVVRGIIEQHGGFIHLDSTEGQGTRVDIFLPVPATDSQSNINAQPGQEAGGKFELILMAEDEESRRQPASELSPASFRKNS